MLNIKNTLLIVVDIQGKLALSVHESERVISRASTLIKAFNVLDIPVVLTEQIPSKIGPTIDEIAGLVLTEPISKESFSCCGCCDFKEVIKDYNRKNIILCGIETHICVYQTAVELLQNGYNVYVAADAVSSRESYNKEIALKRLVQEGIKLTTVEMTLFELLNTAANERFKDILKLIK